MNEKYLIATDLDGTLLKDDKTISLKTKEYFNELISRGHVITLASGRPPRAVINYYNELNLDIPIITYNGAYVYYPQTGKVIYENKFSCKEVLKFISQFEDGEIENIFAENETTLYFLKEDGKFSTWFHDEGMIIKIGDFKEILDSDVYAAVFLFKDKAALEKSYKIKFTRNDLYMRPWYDCVNIAEFATKEFSKASGIDFVRKACNIKKENTIAFGDAENDREMLLNVSYPFAMKNAGKELIELIKTTTEFDNNNDGIYHELKKLLG